MTHTNDAQTVHRPTCQTRSVCKPRRTKTKHRKSPVAFASCPVRDLSSTRVV